MKVTLLVLAAVATVAVGLIPTEFEVPAGKCQCRQKSCSDIGTDESNCLCLVDALTDLYNQKDSKYDKKFVSAYLELHEDKCKCIENCANLCGPDDSIDCLGPVFDRFDCEWSKILTRIANKPGYKEFVADIIRVNTECLNTGCDDPLSAFSECDYLDDHAPVGCIEFGVSAVAKHLEDEIAREAIENYSLELAIFFSKKQRCNGHFDEEQCIADAAEELNYETEPFVSRLVDRMGSCSAIEAFTVIKQAVLDCTTRHSK